LLIRRVWLTDYRNYVAAEAAFSPGLTAVVGSNGQGKSNLLEAVAYLATLASFRGAPVEALVRAGAERAVVRGEAEREGRDLLLETELANGGRNRAQLNRQPLRRAHDLLGALRVTTFAPDDLVMVKGGPGERRRFLDQALVALHPRNDELQGEVERILRQRNALLKQAKGRLGEDIAMTLDVWDAKLTKAGEALGDARAELVEVLAPVLAESYDQVASRSAHVTIRYQPPWREIGLAAALTAGRPDDLRRGLSLVGPHRDDVELRVGGLPARTHASQGEQRSLALALRLASHRVVTDQTGTTPVLLLDDVFSELDTDRSHALLAHLPAGQTILTTAGSLPSGTEADAVLRVGAGEITAGPGSSGLG